MGDAPRSEASPPYSIALTSTSRDHRTPQSKPGREYLLSGLQVARDCKSISHLSVADVIEDNLPVEPASVPLVQCEGKIPVVEGLSEHSPV
jgi:hypothetical protein